MGKQHMRRERESVQTLVNIDFCSLQSPLGTEKYGYAAATQVAKVEPGRDDDDLLRPYFIHERSCPTNVQRVKDVGVKHGPKRDGTTCLVLLVG